MVLLFWQMPVEGKPDTGRRDRVNQYKKMCKSIEEAV